MLKFILILFIILFIVFNGYSENNFRCNSYSLSEIDKGKAYLKSKKVAFCGPLFSNSAIDNDKVVIDFTYNSMLNIKGTILNDIFIAGNDRKFIKAEAYIENNKLIVFSPSVKEPVAVRYAWNSTDKANLFNGDNLPASPFRTDNWENIIIE